MRPHLAVAVIVAVGALAAVAASSAFAQPTRERTSRVLEVLDELRLDEATMNKLLASYTAFEHEREALLATQVELVDAIRVTEDTPAADKLLDRHLTVQRSLVTTEAKFVAKLRKLLPAAQAARARVMLLAPVQGGEPVATVAPTGGSPGYRMGDLFPPGSALDTREPKPCDPFASMHGCR